MDGVITQQMASSLTPGGSWSESLSKFSAGTFVYMDRALSEAAGTLIFVAEDDLVPYLYQWIKVV